MHTTTEYAINQASSTKNHWTGSGSTTTNAVWTVRQTSRAEFNAVNGVISITSGDKCVFEGVSFNGNNPVISCEGDTEFIPHAVKNWQQFSVSKSGYLGIKVPIIEGISSDNPLKNAVENIGVTGAIKQTLQMHGPPDLAGPMKLVSEAIRLRQDVAHLNLAGLKTRLPNKLKVRLFQLTLG